MTNVATAPAGGPKFSILLPTYNRADVLPFAIRSVLNQSDPDFELLIVGDGCTDDTSDVVRRFADRRIRWMDLPKAPNFGYANRNVALRQARGALIAFMAHDDLWFPDHLELLAGSFRAAGIDIAYSRPLWVIPGGWLAPAAFDLLHPPTLTSFLDRKQNRLAAACVMHRRSCFARDGYWNEDLPACGDWDMWARIIEGGGKRNVAYLPEPTCVHFRANWRTDASDRPWLRVWKHFHEIDGFMPEALKIAIGSGVTEQEAVLRLMEAAPDRWVPQIRLAVRQALDRRVAQSDQLTEALLDPNSTDSGAVKAVGDRIVEVQAEVERLKRSTAWQVAMLLHNLRIAAIPPDSRRERLWSRLTRRRPDDQIPRLKAR